MKPYLPSRRAVRRMSVAQITSLPVEVRLALTTRDYQDTLVFMSFLCGGSVVAIVIALGMGGAR